jgi:hypothetical protein
MRPDHGMIRPHEKYQRSERARSRSKKKKAAFDHFVRSQAAGGAQDGQNVAQNWIFPVNTLRVVGSCHDSTTCKVSASRTGQNLFRKTKTMFYHVGLSQDV